MPLPHPRLHLSQAVFSHCENHGRRLHLRDDHQHGGPGCLHYVSGIDQAKTYTAGDRRGYVAIAELNLVVIHRALIVFHRALVLQHDLFLIIE